MAGRENTFPRNYSTSDSFESSLFPDPNTEENREHLFSVDNQVVNDMRRHTCACVKSIGGLPTIPDLPQREYKKKYCPVVEGRLCVSWRLGRTCRNSFTGSCSSFQSSRP